MAQKYLIDESTLKSISDTVRKKTGTTKPIVVSDMADKVETITTPTGLDEPEWIDDICFWDYDGTLISHIPVSQAANLQELPEVPAHEGLTFLGWNYTLEELQVVTYPRDVGAMYATTDGKTHVKLDITNSSYLALPIHFSQDIDGGVSIDWGDGSAVQTISGTGVVTTTHTYSKIGKYEIVFTVADGCTMTLGGGTGSTSFIGGNSSYYKNYLIEAYICNNTELSDYCFSSNQYLKILTIPNTVTKIPSYCMSTTNRLNTLIIPHGVTIMDKYSFTYIGQYSGEKYGYYKSIVSLPETVTTIGEYTNSNTFCKRFIVPSKVIAIPNGCFYYNRVALRFFYPADSITSWGRNNIYYCDSICNFESPACITTFNEGAYCYSLEELILGENVTSFEANINNCYAMKRVVIKTETCSTIYTYLWSGIYGLREMIFLPSSPPAFTKVMLQALQYSFGLTVFVPDEGLSAYKALISTVYNWRIRPLSEYRGNYEFN